MTTETMTAENATTFETKQMPWWLVLMGGILNVIVGILLLTSPIKTDLHAGTGAGILLDLRWYLHPRGNVH